MAELLFWPALVAYGEAAIAYAGDARRPGRLGVLAIWGVRLGWLAQTALLIVQALRADGFPWASRAAALNLFVWLVVGAYLIWGCRPRYRLLGLAVMPPAAVLLALAYAGGGSDAADGDGSTLFVALHAGLVLAGFAGFALAAGLGGLFLWHERRLKRRDAGILRTPAPSLDALDRLGARTIAVSLAALSVGIAVGLVRLPGSELDAAMVVTALAWACYAMLLVLRADGRVRGRRAARLALAAFPLVAVALAVAHFA